MDRSTPPSRRAVLATIPVVVAGGCTVGRPAPPSGPSAAQITDDGLRTRARSREFTLVAAYEQAAAMHPGLASVLIPVRDHHSRHAAALAPPSGTSPTPTTPSATTPSTATATPTTPSPATAAAGRSAGPLATVADTPTGRATTITALRKLEVQAALAGRDACLAASAALAPVLASIRAAETAHGDLLDGFQV
ncbi:MAG: hypothetical protein ACQSGP_29700 [Frankia sp.]